MANNNYRVAKNTIYLYVRMFVVLVVSLYTTRIVLRSLGVIDYGVYNVVGGFVSMFTFLNTSMSNGIQRFYNFKLGRKRCAGLTEEYNTAIQIQLILTIVVVFVLETVGLWYMYSKMVIPEDRFIAALYVFHFSVISIAISMMQTPYSAAIMANEHMDYFANVSIFDVVAKLSVAFATKFTSHDKLVFYAFLQMSVTICSFLLYYVYAKKNYKSMTLTRYFNVELFKSMFSFAGWNMFGSFAYMIKSQGLNLLLNAFFGPIVNAARGISSLIMGAIQGFQLNIVTAFRPQIIQSYAAGEFVVTRNLFYSLSKISFVLLSILSIPVLLELKYILSIWLGNVIPEFTVSFTILVLLNMIISSLTTPVSVIVHATGKMKIFQLVTGTIVFSILPISWIFLKMGSNPNAVYIVSLAVTIINQIVCIFLLRRIFDFSLKEYTSTVIIPCFVFFVASFMISSVTMFINSCFLRLCITTICSIIVSVLIAYIVVLNKSERELLKTFIFNLFKKV